MDPDLLVQAAATNRCSACTLLWKTCSCDPEARTESIASLLSNKHMFPNDEKRHLCIFAYHSYHRWTNNADELDYTAACTPPWEGWYAGWLKPLNADAVTVPWSEEKVLECEFEYPDGSAVRGFIDIAGDFFIMIPGPRPPGGRGYDVDRRLMLQKVTVSQGLTMEEILGGTRGVVRGSGREANDGRRIICVERETKDGWCACRKIDETVGEVGELVDVETERIRRVAGYLVEEARWRMRRRFCKRIGSVVQAYLKGLFEEGRRNDWAVRFRMGRKWRSRMLGGEMAVEKIGVCVRGLGGVMGGGAEESVEEEKENGSSSGG